MLTQPLMPCEVRLLVSVFRTRGAALHQTEAFAARLAWSLLSRERAAAMPKFPVSRKHPLFFIPHFPLFMFLILDHSPFHCVHPPYHPPSAHNKIKGSLPAGLTGLFSLRALHVGGNALSEVPEQVTKLRYPSDEMDLTRLFARPRLTDKQLRQQHIVATLSGGPRPCYRSTERLPPSQVVGQRPAGAGDRRGWPLVRFAIFGDDSPSVKAGDLGDDDEHVVDEEDSSEDETREEELDASTSLALGGRLVDFKTNRDGMRCNGRGGRSDGRTERDREGEQESQPASSS